MPLRNMGRGGSAGACEARNAGFRGTIFSVSSCRVALSLAESSFGTLAASVAAKGSVDRPSRKGGGNGQIGRGSLGALRASICVRIWACIEMPFLRFSSTSRSAEASTIGSSLCRSPSFCDGGNFAAFSTFCRSPSFCDGGNFAAFSTLQVSLVSRLSSSASWCSEP